MSNYNDDYDRRGECGGRGGYRTDYNDDRDDYRNDYNNRNDYRDNYNDHYDNRDNPRGGNDYRYDGGCSERNNYRGDGQDNYYHNDRGDWSHQDNGRRESDSRRVYERDYLQALHNIVPQLFRMNLNRNGGGNNMYSQNSRGGYRAPQRCTARMSSPGELAGGADHPRMPVAKKDLTHNQQKFCERPETSAYDNPRCGKKIELLTNHALVHLPTTAIVLYEYNVEVFKGRKKLVKREEAGPMFREILQTVPDYIFPPAKDFIYNDVNLIWVTTKLPSPEKKVGGRNENWFYYKYTRCVELNSELATNCQDSQLVATLVDAIATARVRWPKQTGNKFSVFKKSIFLLQDQLDEGAFADASVFVKLRNGVDARIGISMAIKLNLRVGITACFDDLFKFLADNEVGIFTQGMLKKTFNNIGATPATCKYTSQIVEKVLGKVGTTHRRLERNGDHKDLKGEDHVKRLSIATVVGNIDLDCTEYRASSKIQDVGEERIVRFENEILERISGFVQFTGKRPAHIVIYRDGLSEGDFQRTLYEEKNSVQIACRSIAADFKPTLTYIVVTKRHHTRFFLKNEEEGLQEHSFNVRPGTLVEDTVTTKDYYDFFLSTQVGQLGLARPTHYYVLHNDWKVPGTFWPTVTHALTCLFCRSTSTVNLPAPVLYAHLAAKKAKETMDGALYANALCGKFLDTSSFADLAQLERCIKNHAELDGMTFV